MRIKRCVGEIIYNDQKEIFLMTSPKWNSYVVPGGAIKDGESEESALHREILEELGIPIDNLVKVGEKIKPPSKDFKDPDIEFHFINFFARALQTDITPNSEISDYGWYSVNQALNLTLLDTTRQMVIEFADFQRSKQ